MPTPREKALLQFPAMYVTLVSVVQAIALESLVSRVVEVGPASLHGWDSVLLWLEVAFLGQTILYAWISYTLLVILTQWLFRVFDFGAAFAIGVFQLVAIQGIGADPPRLFFIMATVGFLSGAWISHSNIGAAAAQEENRATLSALPRDTITALLGSIGVLGAIGALVMGTGRIRPALAATILLIANALLLVAQGLWFRWWEKVVRPGAA